MKVLLRLLMLGVFALLARCAAPDGHRTEERVASRSQALDGQPFVSAEFPVGPPPVRPLDPAAPLLDVAANDDGYLLTYAINGLTFVRWNAATGSASIFATLPTASSYVAHAVAAGDGWLVVYQQGTRFSATIAADGTVSTPTALPGTCQDGVTGLARSPTTALLSDGCGGGVLLDLNGQPLLTLVLVPPFDFQNPPAYPTSWTGHLTGGQVAFNGTDYVVMYAYSSTSLYPKDIGVIRVSPSGDVAPALFVSKPAVPYKGVDTMGLAVNGSTFLLLLRQYRTSGPEFNVVYKTLQVSADAFTLGPETLLTTPSGNSFEPSDRKATAFALGTRFGIVREDPSGALSLLVVDPANALPTTTQALLPPFAGAPVALTAATATGFVVAAGPRGVRFDSAIHALDVPAATVIQFLGPEPAQSRPSFAFNGESYLAGWLEGAANSAGPGVFMQRLSNSAQILEPTSIPLSPNIRYGQNLAVSADPKGFVLGWSRGEYPSASGARISSNDPFVVTPFPPIPLRETASISGVAVASDGDSAVGAWSGEAVLIARFSETGAWSPSLLIANTAYPHRSTNPALVFHAGHFVVLWLDVTDDLGGFAIYGARVAADLSLIDSSPKQILGITTNNPRSLEVVAVGDQLVLAWSGFYTHGSDPITEEVYTARLSSALDVIDPGAIRVATPQIWNDEIGGRRTALRWDGSNVWLLWLDAASGLAARGGLVGQRFSATLAPVDAAPWLVTNNLDNRAAITLTGGEDGRSLVGYTIFDAVSSQPRVRARFLSADPFADGIPCATASQCRNNACSAGYCSTDTGAGGAGGQTGGGTAAGGSSTGGIATGDGGIATGGSTGGSTGGIATGGSTGGIATGGSTGGIATGGGGIATGGTSGGVPSGGNEANGGYSGTPVVAGNGGALTGDAGASNEAGQVGVAGAADAGESNGGAITTGGAVATGGAAGGPGHHSGNCSAAGPSSSRSTLSGLLLLATTLTLVRRRRSRPAASRAAP